jgi:hypothetical protein
MLRKFRSSLFLPDSAPVRTANWQGGSSISFYQRWRKGHTQFQFIVERLLHTWGLARYMLEFTKIN